MKLNLLTSLFLLLSINAFSGVSITSVSQTPDELKIKSDLEQLHQTYDLSKWQYTKDVQVDENARTPHSHPVLTMSTQTEYLNNQTKLLSTYLHEQFHWHMIINGKPSKQEFRRRIKEVFPVVPIQRPEGSGSEGSTLSHIIVCYLEYIALTELVGQEKAKRNLLTNSYYTWVYQTVTNPANTEKLDTLLVEFGLN